MYKEWFIFIENKKEGPFSFQDLKKDLRITPDTWVWKKGFTNWKKIREVEELKELFEEEKPAEEEEEEVEKKKKRLPFSKGEIALDMQGDPSFWFWILILILLTYIFMLFLHK